MLCNGSVNGALLNLLEVNGWDCILIPIPPVPPTPPDELGGCRKMRYFGTASKRPTRWDVGYRPAWLGKTITCNLVQQLQIYPPESAWIAGPDTGDVLPTRAEG